LGVALGVKVLLQVKLINATMIDPVFIFLASPPYDIAQLYMTQVWLRSLVSLIEVSIDEPKLLGCFAKEPFFNHLIEHYQLLAERWVF
jgi:hypothetical protein